MPALPRAARSDADRADAIGLSPETLTEYALRHGMVAWPPAPLTDGVLRTHMTRALQGVRLLEQLTRHFTDAAIDVVSLKGPAFSQWLYGDPCARRFGDLDLLVATAQLDPAVRLLRELGFASCIPGRAGELVYAGIGAVTMARGSDHHVDLHWRPAARRFSPVLDAAGVLRQSIEIPFGSGVARIPRAEHGAALALTHAAKHLWYALEQPFAIAVLVRRSDIDWDEVRALMRAGGGVRGGAAGLAIAADLFGIDVPAAFQADTDNPDVRELRRCARLTMGLPPGTFPDRSLERHIHRLSFDRAADRFRYDVRRITEPTRADVDWVRLPQTLTSLYWPLRVVRLGATVLGLSPADASAG
ncbi:MAG: nucleotidyltransferase family protein [Vicinamibacterales bacterium]